MDCSSGNFNYIYQYKDHLGNVRLSYADKDNNGTIAPNVPLLFQTVWEDCFESATGWDGSGSSIWGWPVSGFDSSIKRTGIYSAKLDPGAEWIRAVHSNDWIPISNTETTKYKFSCWVYLENVAGNRANIFLFMNTPGETNYYSIVESVTTYTTGQWVYLENRVSVPSNISKLNIRLDSQNAGIAWFDDVKIEKVIPNSQNEIVEENNYYPFGLKHKDGNNVVTSTNPGQKYKYNGKELQDELGLNVYDMEARNYDPALGRFMNIDPMAESYYQHTPYNYVGSNPIVRTDPTGMDWYTDAKGNQTYNEKLTKDNASSILKEGQKYSGTTATENVSNDVGNYTLTYNADGSISSSNNTQGNSISTTSMAEAESSQPTALVAATTALAAIEIDVLTPDPSDIVPQKWIVEGVVSIVAAGVITYYSIDNYSSSSPSTTIGHYDSMSQRGNNNGKLQDDELESIRAKKAAGTATSSDLQKLKKHEKNTGQRSSRQSKDKK